MLDKVKLVKRQTVADNKQCNKYTLEVKCMLGDADHWVTSKESFDADNVDEMKSLKAALCILERLPVIPNERIDALNSLHYWVEENLGSEVFEAADVALNTLIKYDINGDTYGDPESYSLIYIDPNGVECNVTVSVPK
jgi:hypothetical protein